jgi:hypothetical protein
VGRRRGRSEDNCGFLYTYAWKQHKESPCIAIFISN